MYLAFLGGILFTAFVLFIGVKIEKVKIEFGDFKDSNNGGSPTTPNKDTRIK